jgi:hypothetical protein
VQDRNIALNDAMILPYHANLDRMKFSERTMASAAARLLLSSSPFQNSSGEYWAG